MRGNINQQVKWVVASAAAHMAPSPKWSSVGTALKGLVFDSWWSQLTDEDIYGGAGNWLALGVAELANKLLAFAERDISAETGEDNWRAVEEERGRGLVGQGR